MYLYLAMLSSIRPNHFDGLFCVPTELGNLRILRLTGDNSNL